MLVFGSESKADSRTMLERKSWVMRLVVQLPTRRKTSLGGWPKTKLR